MAKLDLGAEEMRQNGWPGVLDKLILGVTHQISNRVATLAGVSDILAGDPSIPPILRALAAEVPRLEESIRLLRLLAVPDNEMEEALEAHRLVDDAVSLARLSSDTWDVEYAVQDGRGAPPVLARPVALTHTILVALAAAAAETGGQRTVTVRFSVVDPELLISANNHQVLVRLLSAGRTEDQ